MTITLGDGISGSNNVIKPWQVPEAGPEAIGALARPRTGKKCRLGENASGRSPAPNTEHAQFLPSAAV